MEYSESVQYFIKMTVVSRDDRLEQHKATPTSVYSFIIRKCLRSLTVLGTCLRGTMPSFHHLGSVPHSLLPSDLGPVATFPTLRPSAAAHGQVGKGRGEGEAGKDISGVKRVSPPKSFLPDSPIWVA